MRQLDRCRSDVGFRQKVAMAGTIAVFIGNVREGLARRTVVRRRLAVIARQCGRSRLSEAFIGELETALRRAQIHVDRPLDKRASVSKELVRLSLKPFAPAEVEFGCERQLVDLVVDAVGRVAPLTNLRIWRREFALPSGRRIDLLCKATDRSGKGDLVALEFKRGTARLEAIQQLHEYIEELRAQRFAAGRRVRGILLARKLTRDRSALK